MIKYLVAPAQMPDELTWFKWEAYATWLSGFGLMIIVYYFDAELFLIDTSVLASPVWGRRRSASSASRSAGSSTTGSASRRLGAATTLRCRGALRLPGGAGLRLSPTCSAAAAPSCRSGALVGTIMVANVFHVIIPNQKMVVADLIEGEAARPEAGRDRQAALGAQQLSDPAGHLRDDQQPLSAGFRHPLELADLRHRPGDRRGDPPFLQQRHKGLPSPWWTWGVAVAGMVAIVLLEHGRAAPGR